MGYYNDDLLKRDKELVDIFNEKLRTSRKTVKEIIDETAQSPSSRFWITPRKALLHIHRLIEGDTLPEMLPRHRERYIELRTRFEIIKKQQPKLKDCEIARIVVEQPAPSFYLMPTTATKLIYSTLRHRRK